MSQDWKAVHEANRVETERLNELARIAYQDGYMMRARQKLAYRPDQKHYDASFDRGRIAGTAQGPLYNIDSPKLEKMRRDPNAFTKQQISDELRKVVRAAVRKEKSVPHSSRLKEHLTHWDMVPRGERRCSTLQDHAPSFRPARYAKGQVAVSCPSDGSGAKTRAMRLATALKGKWSSREKAYIMSPTKAAKLHQLFDAGTDARLELNKNGVLDYIL